MRSSGRSNFSGLYHRSGRAIRPVKANNTFFMKLKYTKLATLAAALITFGAVAGGANGALILNPGNDLALVGGEISGWNQVTGSNWTQRGASPIPEDGPSYFFAGAGALAELSQTVDVSIFSAGIDSSIQQFTFSGYVRSFDQASPDTSRIILEYQNTIGEVIESFDSGEIANRTAWQLVTDQRIAPAGTRNIEVRLISNRNSGTNNDGYFDSLSLTTSAIPEPSSTLLLGLGVLGVASRRLRAK